MSADGEQVRWNTDDGVLVVDAEDYDTLLAELEQAERERDEARDAYKERHRDAVRFEDRADAAEAQLAKVPALVEAVTAFLKDLDEDTEPYDGNLNLLADLVDALAAFEQEQSG